MHQRSRGWHTVRQSAPTAWLRRPRDRCWRRFRAEDGRFEWDSRSHSHSRTRTLTRTLTRTFTRTLTLTLTRVGLHRSERREPPHRVSGPTYSPLSRLYHTCSKGQQKCKDGVSTLSPLWTRSDVISSIHILSLPDRAGAVVLAALQG